MEIVGTVKSEEPRRFYKDITVEPVITLYMMAFMITSVVEQSLFLNKACEVNHQYNSTICQNLHKPEYKAINDEIQITVSTFLQWNSIAGHIIPIFLALFMGAWSDKRGRKLPLIMGLFGKFIYSVMIVVNTLQPKWRLEYIIYTATIPSTLTGADVIIFAAAYSYISDVSAIDKRTLRITILDVCYLTTMPIGIALGRYLFSEVTNRSYTILFIINASLLLYAILYSFVTLEWTTQKKQITIWQSTSSTHQSNYFLDFFDKKHVMATYNSLTKWRHNNGRQFLIIFIFIMMLYTFQRDEKDYTYLFFTKEANWDVNKYSKFRTVQSSLYAIVMLIVMPIMNRVIGLRDTIIIMIGSCAHAVCRIIFIQATTNTYYYIALGPIVAPALRSMVSKLVSSDERGCVFSVLSVADNAVPFISGFLYTQVYNSTIKDYPQGIFWLTFATQVGVFLGILYVHFKSTSQSLIHEENPDCAEKCIKPVEET